MPFKDVNKLDAFFKVHQSLGPLVVEYTYSREYNRSQPRPKRLVEEYRGRALPEMKGWQISNEMTHLRNVSPNLKTDDLDLNDVKPLDSHIGVLDQ